MALFTVTERGTFKRCERQWRLSSKNGMHLGPIVAPIYLSVGTLVHNGSKRWLLDSLEEGGPHESYKFHVLSASIEMVEKARARYLKQVGVPMSTPEEEVLGEAIHFAVTMAENYEIRWGSPLPEGFRIIRPEQRATIPVKGTEHPCETCCETWAAHANNVPSAGKCPHWVTDSDNEFVACPDCSGGGTMLHYLDMRFDGLIIDAEGNIHVLEHKTYNARPKLESLQTNDQFLAYIWGAEQLGLGEVAGLAYDGLWRRAAIPRGKTFEDLFMRHTLTRTPAEKAEFEHMLPIELNKMWMMRPSRVPFEDVTFNRSWQGCWDCSFGPKKGRDDLCRAISRGETSMVKLLMDNYFTERDDDDDEDESDTEVEVAA